MWIRPLITFLGISLVIFLPLSQDNFSPSITLVLYGLGIVVLLSHIYDTVAPDFQHGHLAWLMSHQYSIFRYCLNQIIVSFLKIACPLALSFFCIHLLVYPITIAFILSLSFLIILSTMICWGLILSIAQAQNGQSLLTITLAPLAIPSLLIAESLVSSIAAQEMTGYYLGMQLGILLVSGGLSLSMVPLIIKNLDWS